MNDMDENERVTTKMRVAHKKHVGTVWTWKERKDADRGMKERKEKSEDLPEQVADTCGRGDRVDGREGERRLKGKR